MFRQSCDRCGADVTDKPSGVLRGIKNANAIKNGLISLEADLCPPCYRAVVAWVKTWPPQTAKKVAPHGR